MVKKQKRWILWAAVICLVVGGYYLLGGVPENIATTAAEPASETQGADPDECDECLDGTYYSLFDMDSEEHIEHMSRVVNEEDEIITGDNKHYKIMDLDGQNAHCQVVEDNIGYRYVPAKDQPAAASAGEEKPYQAVAIYATHTDESYVPTFGTESKEGGGDILDVAGALAQTLEEQGVTVVHSDNIHDPHDKNAYQRSRETAAELLQEAPAIMIDVHRDGVPDPEYYETELDGKEVTQIRLVVGRQNENSAANLEFAEKMKAYYDEVKPGLIKSIYMAKGNYNQDMAPHSILLEIGTHTNTLEEAEAGAEEFAQVLPEFLGIANNETASSQQFISNAPTAQEEKGMSGTGKFLLLAAGVLIIGGAAVVFMNKKGQ